MLALAGLAAAAPAAASAPDPEGRVTVAFVPRETSLEDLAEASDRFALGFYSPGLGSVPPAQTYLDVGQGNRLWQTLYPYALPLVVPAEDGVRPSVWRKIEERAREAPARLVPGLLADRLAEAKIGIAAMPGAGSAALSAVDSRGGLERRTECRIGVCPEVSVGLADLDRLARIAARLGPHDLLIALARPPALRRLAPAAIAGPGFAGELRSETTRTGGYVLSTDVAPTVLDHLGVEVPGAMSGAAIGSGGERDVEALVALQSRLLEVAPRRRPVLGTSLVLWLALALAPVLLLGARWARLSLPVLGVTLAWLPVLLVACAALAPPLLVEQLTVAVGAPLAALLSIHALRPRFGPRAAFAAFALGCAGSVALTAADMIAGSPFTSLSLLGPNPALGVRFFGIGNELEAVIGAMLPLGSAAAVTALRPEDPRRAVAIVVAIATVAAVLVFAPGRFGAAVGTAIGFPAAAAALILAALGVTRRRVALVVAAPAVGLVVLIAIDLLAGGSAHLTRSVLEAEGLDEIAEVAERRTRLAAASFRSFAESPFFLLALALLVAGILARRRVRGWFDGFDAAWAGLWGALAFAVVGTVTNDSGALLGVLAIAYLAGFVAVVWAAQRAEDTREGAEAR